MFQEGSWGEVDASPMVVSCLIHLDTSLFWKLAGLGGRWRWVGGYREVGVVKEGEEAQLLSVLARY